MTQAHVQLHIEELVLSGFAPGERYRIAEAVERELTRLIHDQGVPSWLARGGELPRLSLGPLNVASGSGAEKIGIQVANEVYGGLRQ